MEGEKIRLVKSACEFMVSQMSPKDKLGLVEYNSVTREVFQLSRTSEDFKTEASRMIKSMCPQARTNLSGGLFLGFEQQQKNQYLDWEKEEESENAPDLSDTVSVQSSFVDVEMRDTDTFSEASFIDIDPPEGAAAAPTSDQSSTAHAPVPAPAPAPAPTVPVHPTPPQAAPTPCQQPRQQPRPILRNPRHPVGRFGLDGGRVPVPPSRLLAGREAPKPRVLEADAVRSIFLFTDGLANEGVTSQEKLVGTLGKLLANASHKVRVCTFGFGDDHSPELLGELARAGGGTYYYIEKEDGIATAFGDALGGLLSVAAQNVTLDFVPAKGVRARGVHCAFANSVSAEGVQSVAVGDLFSEENKDILFDVELDPIEPGGEGWEEDGASFTIGTLRLKYLDVVGACLGSEELQCVVTRAKVLPAGMQSDVGVAVQRARVETARAMQEAEACARSERYGPASDNLRVLMSNLRLLGQNPNLRGTDAQLVDQLVYDCEEACTNVSTKQAYMSKGNKILWAKMRGHEQQRTACREDADSALAGMQAPAHTYATPTQMGMRTKSKSMMGVNRTHPS
mmetsp:Transcript_24245/g.49104  ORF Transcript_24245/g.49104 Transcript_24245/m.49104 type:complete len:567 (+) Transcript_24245:1-1701(+)